MPVLIERPANNLTQHGRGFEITADTDPPSAAGQHALAVDPSVPLVSFPDRRTAWLYRAYVVPQTVVIDHEGLVLFVRHGVIDTREGADSVIAAARPMTP